MEATQNIVCMKKILRLKLILLFKKRKKSNKFNEKLRSRQLFTFFHASLIRFVMLPAKNKNKLNKISNVIELSKAYKMKKFFLLKHDSSLISLSNDIVLYLIFFFVLCYIFYESCLETVRLVFSGKQLKNFFSSDSVELVRKIRS